jgi:hypothetical protein
MKRLVLLGEGHGEVSALPILATKILKEKDAKQEFFVDDNIVRTHNPPGLIKWNKETKQQDSKEWSKYLKIAARRSDLGGILAIYDGDAKKFPAGSDKMFCPKTAGRLMAEAAKLEGAGKTFSLAIVFACVEYESWIIAGTESLSGKCFDDERPIFPKGITFPDGDPESHGKRWLERNVLSGYRPNRDQGSLTELIDLKTVRAKQLRSFKRLDNAIDQLLDALTRRVYIVTP